MRPLLLFVLAAALSGCALVYKLPTRQGNVIEQKQLDQLKVGMTREQVKFLMGTPLAASPFNDARWDFIGYYRSPRGKVSTRTVSVHFAANQVARLEGTAPTGAVAELDEPDLKTVVNQEKKDALEKERGEAPKEGVVIEQPEKKED
jgi:outer membrane protein assembly factor BamE